MLASEFPHWFIRVLAFVFGALWGSFANVVIYRWPREMSVVSPPSHCFACGTTVRPYDNVPILAWLWLRGRCRHCKACISPRYALVELLFAVVSTAIAERVFYGTTALAPWAAFAHYGVRFSVAFVLLVATFIDLDEMIVPWFVKWFALVPLAGAALLPEVPPAVGLVPALAGAGMGYLGLRTLFIDGYKMLTGRRGMGLGDAEILLVVGALLGPAGVLFSLGAGAVQGVVATGIAMLFRARIGPAHADEVEDEEEGEEAEGEGGEEGGAEKDEGAPDVVVAEARTARGVKLKVPFVPFLALAALEYLLGADALVNEYLRLMRGE
jgi:leader peptidase (prepilin peptidase)/N-methyltransferase